MWKGRGRKRREDSYGRKKEKSGRDGLVVWMGKNLSLGSQGRHLGKDQEKFQ